jgi:hypothetical protein
MGTRAMFATASARAALYESFYVRAVSPDEPVGVWIRYTVRKPPGRTPTGSLWCTVFDAGRGRPFMHKLTTHELRAPAGAWISIGDASAIGPGSAYGECGPARWSLRFASKEAELRHLSPAWLYRTPLPRTKLTSPAPAASFDGTLELAAGEGIELRGWPGMVGHNWGSEHAERWIWLHGVGFAGAPDAWLDVALGRVRVGGRLTPWLASGALSLDGERRRIGGLAAPATDVAECADGCALALRGERGMRLSASVAVPAQSAAGWRYSDPDSERSRDAEHDVINCSVAALELSVRTRGGAARILRSEHGCAYELGMRAPHDTDDGGHGVPLAPFADS